MWCSRSLKGFKVIPLHLHHSCWSLAKWNNARISIFISSRHSRHYLKHKVIDSSQKFPKNPSFLLFVSSSPTHSKLASAKHSWIIQNFSPHDQGEKNGNFCWGGSEKNFFKAFDCSLKHSREVKEKNGGFMLHVCWDGETHTHTRGMDVRATAVKVFCAWLDTKWVSEEELWMGISIFMYISSSCCCCVCERFFHSKIPPLN